MVGQILTQIINSKRAKKTRMVCIKLTEKEYNYVLEMSKKLDESKSRIIKEGYLALYLKNKSRVYLGFINEIKKLQETITKLNNELKKYKR